VLPQTLRSPVKSLRGSLDSLHSPASAGCGSCLLVPFPDLVPKLKTLTPEWKAAQEQLEIDRKMNPYSGPFAKVAGNSK
jgi:hypothetical protein